jgi:hypothetical protein
MITYLVCFQAPENKIDFEQITGTDQHGTKQEKRPKSGAGITFIRSGESKFRDSGYRGPCCDYFRPPGPFTGWVKKVHENDRKPRKLDANRGRYAQP